MKISLAFLRIFFVILSLFFMTAFMVTLPAGSLIQKIFIGLGVGLLFSGLLLSLEALFRRYHLKAFNTAILGLFVGYLLGQALILICNGVLSLTHMHLSIQPQTLDLIRLSVFLIGTYLGTLLTLYFSEQFKVSIPFIKLSAGPKRKKDLLIDVSALSDSRILDLASTGLVDNSLVLSAALLKKLYAQAEIGDEMVKDKAKRCIETLKKLEATPELGLRFDETRFPPSSESFNQLIRLARLNDYNILTADISQVQLPAVEGIKIVNLNSLSNALKPLMETGESMKIKIQRYGKEPNQGVGYLEDGTMVVVNGGGDFISECINVQVLSVKHTSSGRMIFCNTMEEASANGNRIEV